MELSRREVLGSAVTVFGAAVAPDAGEAQTPRPAGARTRPANEPFGYCLNTSTIRGNKLDIVGVVDAAAKAGFHAIEPWIGDRHVHDGRRQPQGSRQADRRRRTDRRRRHRVQLVPRRRRRAARGGDGAAEGRHGQGGADRRHAHRRAAGQRKKPASASTTPQSITVKRSNWARRRRAAAAGALGHASRARAALARHT